MGHFHVLISWMLPWGDVPRSWKIHVVYFDDVLTIKIGSQSLPISTLGRHPTLWCEQRPVVGTKTHPGSPTHICSQDKCSQDKCSQDIMLTRQMLTRYYAHKTNAYKILCSYDKCLQDIMLTRQMLTRHAHKKNAQKTCSQDTHRINVQDKCSKDIIMLRRQLLTRHAHSTNVKKDICSRPFHNLYLWNQKIILLHVT